MTSSADAASAPDDRWLELSVECDVEAVEAVSEILGREAAGTAVRPTRLLRDARDELSAREDPTAPYVVTAHLPVDARTGEAVERAERALWHLQAFGLRPVGEIVTREVDASSWTEAWKRDYVAQRIGRVVVVPSWNEDEPVAPGEVVVRLDPGMAFGTGLHPTTRGCLGGMQDAMPMPAEVLDVGCGSGILAISAVRLGAGRVDACDTDPLAVEVARDNARRNGVDAVVHVTQGTLPATPSRRYGLVLSNLVAAVLVDLAPRLAAHVAPGGRLIASGIIEPRASEVEAAFAAVGLGVTERRVDGEWVTLGARPLA